jgi:hypothetical protein
MMSSRKKAQKLSAYEADPITVEDCIRSKNWETPINGNSWKDAILNEIGNLMKFKVFEVIGWQDVPTGERVWQIVVNFLTNAPRIARLSGNVSINANAVFVLGGII